MASSSRRTRDLPDDCWDLVLSRLQSKADRDAAALTCRRWRSLDARSRRSLHFVKQRNLSVDQGPCLHLFLLQALHSFPNISSITIYGAFSGLHHSFSRVFLHKGFAQMTSLDIFLPNYDRNDGFVKCLAANCPSLIDLILEIPDISDADMYSLADGCPLLQSLDMPVTSSITDYGINGLLLKCADMWYLSVGGGDIQGWGFRHGKHLEKIKARGCDISDAGLAEGMEGATSLQELNLSYIQSEPRLSSIWEWGKGLEVLNLRGSHTLDDIALKKIMEGCKNLRVLNVSLCYKITFDGWQAIALLGGELEKLAVFGCDGFYPQDLLTIAEGCPKLRLLKVSDSFAHGIGLSLAHFRMSRPAVEVKFYDADNIHVNRG